MSTSLTNRFVALGFIGAVVATILGAAVSPDHPLTAVSAFGRAIFYIFLVFATAAIATYAGFLIRGEGRTIRAKEIAIRTAATTLWLPPLLMFSDQKSLFVLVIWAVLIVEVARLIAFVRGISHDTAETSPVMPPDVGMFSVLKQDFPSGISILGVLIIQGAVFGAVGGHAVLPGLLYFAGTTAIAYRTLRMFQNLPAVDTRTLRERILAALIPATFLVGLAWLPHVVGSGGSGVGGDFTGTAASVGRSPRAPQADGTGARKDEHKEGAAAALARLRSLLVFGGSESRANSFEVAKRIFGSTFARQTDGTSARSTSLQNTRIASAVVVSGPVFAGVELYPEVERHPRLVAPPLPGTRSFGAPRSDSVSIPFDGFTRSGGDHRMGRHRIR